MAKNLANPSPEQHRIAESSDSTIVVANPGTGKTTTLSLKVAQLLEDGVDPEKILCITFTKKAKKEMYDAIHARVKGDHAAKKVRIHTFHSFAYDHLLDLGVVPDGMVDDNLMRYSIFRSFMKHNTFEYAKDYIINEMVPNTTNAIKYIKNFGILADDIDVGRAQQILEANRQNVKGTPRATLEEAKKFLEHFVMVYKQYESAKQKSIDYTDILLLFLKNYKEREFEYALIDEMQDMNVMQADIARRVAEKIFLVGDEKQAIFGFQGGSTRHLVKFHDDCKKMMLTENWRSTNQILDYAKQYYIENITDGEQIAEEMKEFGSKKVGDKPQIIATDDPYPIIQRLIAENPEKKIGILTRTNGQISDISTFLELAGIPHTSVTSKGEMDKAWYHITKYLLGLFHDDTTHKVRAAFTALSPYTLKEAFELSSMAQNESHTEPRLWRQEVTPQHMDELFENTILPICISYGLEWFVTAESIKKNIDQYLSLDTPTSMGLFDYLAVAEDPQPDHDTADDRYNVVLSTIHKAKGREFDIVIYLPKDSRSDSLIDSTREAILQSASIDAGGELKDEQTRLHFVAFTRAKEKLVIIAKSSRAPDLYIDGLCEMVDGDFPDDTKVDYNHTVQTSPSIDRYREAYSLFVSGRTKESKILLDKKEGYNWIEEFIAKYFNDINHLSYSRIKTKPSEFLEMIIGMTSSASSKGAMFGKKFHEIMHSAILDGKYEDAIPWDKHDEEAKSKSGLNLARAVQNAFTAIDQLEEKYPGLKVESLEKMIEVPISALTNYDIDLTFTGVIDVIFKHDSGYLIIDYKTDRSTTSTSNHRKQLAAYRRMLAYIKDIPEESIDTYILYVAKRGAISTGRTDYEIVKGYTKSSYQRFENDLQQILEWKQDSSRFIDDLLAERGSINAICDVVIEKLKISRALA